MKYQFKNLNNGYAVDTNGIIYSELKRGRFPTKSGQWRILKQRQYPNGYKYVSFGDKNLMIHRIVAQTFLTNPLHKPFVCHKDDDRHNNCVDNLYFGTRSENTRDAISNDRFHRGEMVTIAKLKNADIPLVRELLKNSRMTQARIGEIFGVSKSYYLFHCVREKMGKYSVTLG